MRSILNRVLFSSDYLRFFDYSRKEIYIMGIHLFFQVMSKICKIRVILEIFSLYVLVACSMLTFPDFQVFAQVTEEDDTTEKSDGHFVRSYNKTGENDEEILPISRGYVHGKVAYFVATDASNNETANSIFQNTGWRVNFAPILTQIPNSTLSQGFEFLNGIRGPGAFGFQLPVASGIPDDENYNPLLHLNLVKWNENVTISILKSVPEIISAAQNGDLQIIPTNITINSPAVIW
jgi:hypothetical protein